MIKPFVVIVPAAGRGDRFNQEMPKQYIRLEGQSILELSLKPLLDFSECVGVCIVIDSDDQYWSSISIEGTKLNFIEGGEKRFDSVMQGLDFWENSNENYNSILIHDAVRPCVKSEDVRSLLESLDDDEIDGAILGFPCKDTMKEVSTLDFTIKKTVDRDSLWMAHTPQVFRKEILFKARKTLETEDQSYTDEAALIEARNGKVKVVKGSWDNIKITFPEDLKLAKSILTNQGRFNH